LYSQRSMVDAAGNKRRNPARRKCEVEMLRENMGLRISVHHTWDS